MKKKIDYIDIITKTIVVLGTILVIYWYIQLMFGSSPSNSQFNAVLIIILISLVVNLYYRYGKFNQFIEGTFPRFERNIEQSFSRIKEDMNKLREDTSTLRENMSTLKTDTNLIKKKLKI